VLEHGAGQVHHRLAHHRLVPARRPAGWCQRHALLLGATGAAPALSAEAAGPCSVRRARSRTGSPRQPARLERGAAQARLGGGCVVAGRPGRALAAPPLDAHHARQRRPAHAPEGHATISDAPACYHMTHDGLACSACVRRTAYLANWQPVTLCVCCSAPATNEAGDTKRRARGCGACFKRWRAPLGRGLVQLADGRHEARLAVRDERARRVAQRVAVPGARAAAVSQGRCRQSLCGRAFCGAQAPRLRLGPRRLGSRRPGHNGLQATLHARQGRQQRGRTWRQSWSAARSGPRIRSSAPGRQTCRRTRRPRAARPARPPPAPSPASPSRCATAAVRPRFRVRVLANLPLYAPAARRAPSSASTSAITSFSVSMCDSCYAVERF
jgi:hypothetical protein